MQNLYTSYKLNKSFTLKGFFPKNILCCHEIGVITIKAIECKCVNKFLKSRAVRFD